MKNAVLLSIAALASAGAAMAEPVTRTTSFDGPKVDATRVSVTDRAAGTYSRTTDAVRASDGATAKRSYDRARTENGVTASGSAIGFGGRTSSFDYARTRTDNGYTASGTATGRNGQNYTLSGQGVRTEAGYARDRTITNGSGTVVSARSVDVTRAGGVVSRNVATTRAGGFPRQGFGGRRH